MPTIRATFLLLLTISSWAAFGQPGSKPVITGQTPSPLTTPQETPITIELSNLIVSDPDPEPVYPNGFTIEVLNGKDYKAQGNRVTPDRRFSGMLSVDVRVSDGKNKSDKFPVQINVVKTSNEAPRITGQQKLDIEQGESLLIELAHLKVDDPDNQYPNDFVLTVFGGSDYSVNGTTITPSPDFSGKLTVPVTVNDGQNESNRFDLKVDVKKARNTPPTITGQQPLQVVQGESLTIELSHLTVDDPDNNYPDGFSLRLFGGKDYTFDGTTVRPSPNFTGQLTVPTTVNDGQNESRRFNLTIVVVEPQNSAPRITGQQPLSILQGESINVGLNHLVVEDPDNRYPADFTLKLVAGSNYSINGSTVTPSADFAGQLTVPVTVNDGRNESNRYDLKIDVVAKQNAAPRITGQQPLSIVQGESINVGLNHLVVEDPDNRYPADFTLKLVAGSNYSINGSTVTPSPDFAGQLTVPVTVNDGQNESNRYDLKIDVVAKQNAAPRITGQQPLSIVQGESINVGSNHLVVEDPDNRYPADFTLKLVAGSNYSINGSTVTPSADFAGQLTVPVTVNDGQNESNRYDLKIDVVAKQNAAPRITGQVPLSIVQGESVNVGLNHLMVEDPDSRYPADFTLKLVAGSNYSVNGSTVTPSADFAGQLTVPVTVNDGQNESNRYDLKIDVVAKQSVVPRITGQQAVSIDQGTMVTIEKDHLTVVDSDNDYPEDFTLKVFPGTGYSFSGTTVTPVAAFTGTLIVPVSVHDGTNESNHFDFQIEVKKKGNVAPQITGQQPLSTGEGSPLTITFDHLIVTDPDSQYPEGFIIKILSGTDYTASGQVITPVQGFSGTLSASVVVNDGQAESNVFPLKINVTKAENVAPQITGQVGLTVNEDESLILSKDHLKVTDPDNTYPQQFSMKLSAGENYQVSGLTITPAPNFSGELSVPVSVNDGSADSAPFTVKITVSPVNDAPVITGQNSLSTTRNTLIPISLSSLIVTDPDNQYPEEFTLKILGGDHYSVAGDIVSPAVGFIGELTVPVMVNDGKLNSAAFNVRIDVVPLDNVAPVITGQRPLRTGQGLPVTIQLSHLLVTDPDNPYPHGFTLKVAPGRDYTVAGTLVTPSTSIASGKFSVTVTVNDGQDDSAPFSLSIEILPPTAVPKIISQRELKMAEDSTLTIRLTDLVVADADHPNYPSGFVLLVSPSPDGTYSRTGNAITPAPNLNGFIEVGVRVSDGKNISDEFQLAILVNPVNDPPEFVRADTTSLAYNPGYDPLSLFENINIRDVDDDHLILAEVGFEGVYYNPTNDRCMLSSGHSSVRAVYDSAGRLFLIGYATIQEYLEALRQVQYHYQWSKDENGNTVDIMRGPRTVYLTVSDGHLASSTIRRRISMDIEISLGIPNAFTPNGDRENDTWHVDLLNADKVAGARVRVFDKHGALLYESAALEQDWDGSFNGKILPVDTYYYTIDLDLSYTTKSYKGTVVVLH